MSSLSASGSGKGTSLMHSARGIGRGAGELGVEVIVRDQMRMLEGRGGWMVQMAVGCFL
jgi:hypothetical protein